VPVGEGESWYDAVRMLERNSSRQRAETWPYTSRRRCEDTLRNAAEQWFTEKHVQTDPKKPYCLARRDSWRENIICSDVADYISEESKRHRGKVPFPLHNALHHGLSSQAMAFNLIGPLIVRRDLDPLKLAMTRMGLHWPDGEVETMFEHSDRSVFAEDSGQPTSIDIALAGKGEAVFIEAKLVEPDFGGCSVFTAGDCEGRNPCPDTLGNCYLHHIGRTYWNRLIEHGISESSMFKGPICPFANYYQFFREVMFAFARNGTFVLLHDDRNPAYLRSAQNGASQGGLWPFLYESIPSDLRGRVGRLTIQCVVQAIAESGRHEDWVHEFEAKYALQ
jgi:POLQ-like helicase